MANAHQIKTISYLKSNATGVTQECQSDEATRETSALLKLLALGRKQIEAGQVAPAAEVFARLDQELLGSVAAAPMRY